MTPETRGPGRKLGLFAATALIMGNMIGSGIFLLPASLAPFAWNGVLAWTFAIAGSVVLAMVIVRLTQAIPDAGGTTAYVGRAFGGLAEFVIGWSYLLGVWLAIATLAVGAISHASHLFPALGEGGWPLGIMLAATWLLTAINLRGIREASAVQLATTVLKIIPLVLVMALAASALLGGAADIPPPASGNFTLSQFSAATALVMFAMLGFESASLVAARVERPEVTVARATVIGTVATGLLYLLFSSAIVLMLPAGDVAASNSPVALFVERFGSGGAAQMVAILAVVSALGALNGWVLVGGEMVRDMAARGELPAYFARTGSTGTPVRALVAGSLIASLCLILNSSGSLQQVFEFLLLLTTATSLWLYLACALAALKLGVARGLALAGLAYSLFTMASAGWEVSLWCVVLMLAGLPLWWLARRASAGQRV